MIDFLATMLLHSKGGEIPNAEWRGEWMTAMQATVSEDMPPHLQDFLQRSKPATAVPLPATFSP